MIAENAKTPLSPTISSHINLVLLFHSVSFLPYISPVETKIVVDFFEKRDGSIKRHRGSNMKERNKK